MYLSLYVVVTFVSFVIQPFLIMSDDGTFELSSRNL
jgi:hypothetical protein